MAFSGSISITSQPQPSIASVENERKVNPKCIAITTIVALLALGAVIVGILAILASVPNGMAGLGSLSQIGWPIGACLSAAGFSSLVALTVVSVIRYCRAKEENAEEPTRADRPGPVVPRPIPTPTPRSQTTEGEPSLGAPGSTPPVVSDPKPKPQPSKYNTPRTTTYPPLPQPSQNYMVDTFSLFQNILDKNGITDLETHLKNVYGDHPPSIKRSSSGNSEKDFILFEKETVLLLLTNEQILSISLKTIQEMAPSECELLFQRLTLIDMRERQLPDLDNQDPWSDFNPRTMGIGDLRRISGNLFSSLPASFPQVCMRMLTAAQIEGLLGTNPSPEILKRVLSTNTNCERAYTKERLSTISQETLVPYLKDLSWQQLDLLPLSYFGLDAFPWDTLLASKTYIQNVLAITQEKNQKTKEFFGVISFEAFQKLAHHLTLDHLPFIRKELLTHKDFPWLPFIQTPQIGFKLRLLDPSILGKANIPWKTLAARKDEIEELFTTYKGRDEKTKKILAALNFKTIQILAPDLRVEHLCCFSPQQLSSEQFPWAKFIEKTGIGAHMHNLPEATFASSSIPWDLLAKKPEEVEAFLTIEIKRGAAPLTKKIISKLGISPIQTLAQALNVDLLFYMDPLHLKNKDFPWPAFFQKKGIGLKMRCLPAKIVAQDHIPWQSFVNKDPQEITTLFSLDKECVNQTREILKEMANEKIIFLTKMNIVTWLHILILLPKERQQELWTETRTTNQS